MTLYDLIKDRLPKEIEATEGNPLHHIEHYKDGYNQALSEIIQILKGIEMGELLDVDKVAGCLIDNGVYGSIKTAERLATALTTQDIYKRLGD